MTGKMLTVLLVEDSQSDVDSVRACFAAQVEDEVHLITVSSLSQALTAMRDRAVDLILLNDTLPDIQGMDAVSTAVCHAGGVPVVVLADQDDDAFAERVIRLGAQDYLVKSALTTGNFHRRLNMAVERQRMVRALDSRVRELAASRARYQNLVRDNADAMIVTDSDGLLLYANPAAEGFFGQSAQDLVGSVQPVPDRDTGGDRIVVERPDGVKATGYRRIAPGQWGCKPAWIVTIRDATARETAAQALETAEQMADHAYMLKSRFLASVSHELRTPLNSILGYAEAMKMELFGTLGSARYGDYVDHIFHSGRQLLTLVNNLLDLSNAETDSIDLHETPVDLVLILRATIGALTHPGFDGMPTVRLEPEKDSVFIYGDGARLMQAFLSVLSNAIKFTGSGGRVTVGLYVQADGDLCITIADTGRGIGSGDLKTIFEPFSRHGEERAHSVPGSDVGLSLTRQLVERHDGQISIESRVDHGTTVTIVLPADRVMPDQVSSAMRMSA